MTNLDDSFAKLLGRQPSDAERQRLYKVRDALDLKNNDALWLVLMALQHYETQYEKIPGEIAKATQDTLSQFKVTADATAKASVATAQANLAQAVATTAKEVAHHTSRKQMWQWAAGCMTLTVITLASLSWYIHKQAYDAGYNLGYGTAYMQAKDEKAAASWANTPEGKLAYKMAKIGGLQQVARCQNNGWVVQNGACFVKTAADGQIYGWQLP